MEGIVKFDPNMESFLLTSESRRWYVVGVYMPPHCASDVRRIEQALELAPTGMEVILLGDLNARLRETQEKKEDGIATELAGSWLMDVTDHYTLRRRY